MNPLALEDNFRLISLCDFQIQFLEYKLEEAKYFFILLNHHDQFFYLFFQFRN